MFVGSRHLTVTGQNFTNIMNNYTSGPMVPPGKCVSNNSATRLNIADFRIIPLGDINLQKEIRLNHETVVGHRPRVRRIYSAKVDRGKSNVTVAMYQGNGAEEVCCPLLS
jgi:hypothetical protein